MTDYSKLPLHPTSEKLVEILCTKTGNNDPMFFRILLVYYFSMIASQMRVNVVGFDSNVIPINSYVINLSPSGTGKGYSSSFVEKHLIGPFSSVFLHNTFSHASQVNMERIAVRRSKQNGTDIAFEEEKVQKEFELVGPFLPIFDSATVPAVKQHRHVLQLANAGSLNFQVDEMGANLAAQVEVLHTFLELYDLGMIKDKLIKSTADNKRLEKIEGGTPANLLLFGTPTKLLDGARTEELFYELLDMGYARRCFFGFSKKSSKDLEITAADMVNNMFNQSNTDFINDVAEQLELLAHESNLHKNIHIEKPELIELMKYRLHCEKLADTYPEQDSVRKAEISHRYFKTLKLAGAYAFMESNSKITLQNLHNAMALTELSGEAFEELMKPEKTYMKLAKYLAETPMEVTLADLVEDLPYFKGSKPQKDEMITLAIAHGYRNNIIIKQYKENNITFLKGESLQETDLDKLLITISNDYAKDYKPTWVEFKDLADLGAANGFHWANHAFVNDHRREDTVMMGFNLIVLDVDSGVLVETAKEVLKGTKCMIYTTKRHRTTDEDGNYLGDRFRVIIPTNYVLELDTHEYKEFINNIIEVMPFEVDSASNQRSKKWETNDGEVHMVDGELFDVLPFIPQTRKNEERVHDLQSSDLDRLESWVMNNTEDGNRNKQLYRYACILADSGKDFSAVRSGVLELNFKLSDSLPEDEIENTILRSIATKML